MEYDFSSELVTWLAMKNMQRKELIPVLQKFNYDEFKGLDNITLSRWVNGKTLPPLYKQFYIAKCLNIDLIDLICRIEASSLKRTAKVTYALNSLIKILDFSALSLSYNEVTNKAFCKIEELTYKEHYEKFSSFNKNIAALDDFFEYIYKLKDKIDYTSISLQNSKKETIGHFCGIKEITSLKNYPLFSGVSYDELQRSSLINVGYFSSTKHYFELLGYTICYHLLTQYPKKDYVYVFVAGYPLYNVTKHLLNVEEQKYFPANNKDSKLGVYLFKIDIIKAICNPLLLLQAQEKLNCLKSCHENDCNICDLRHYSEHFRNHKR